MDSKEYSNDSANQSVITAVVEAMLFTGGCPLTAARIGELVERTEPEVVAAISELNQKYAREGRPYELRRAGAGYQMMLRPHCQRLVRRLYSRTREVRLSLAAIEVLSLVAYRQPVSTHDIDVVRGVDSAAVVRQLRRRNLIDLEQPTEPGGPPRYVTTRRFLELFSLADMDSLPRVQELERA